jgi:hypothetical protein
VGTEELRDLSRQASQASSQTSQLPSLARATLHDDHTRLPTQHRAVQCRTCSAELHWAPRIFALALLSTNPDRCGSSFPRARLLHRPAEAASHFRPRPICQAQLQPPALCRLFVCAVNRRGLESHVLSRDQAIWRTTAQRQIPGAMVCDGCWQARKYIH